MSSDLYNRITNDRGSLPGILNHIPGFEGYMDRKARRTADRMVRDYLVGQLDQRISKLAGISRRLLDQNGLKGMSRMTSVTAHLQTYHDRIKAAAPGYSGFYEAIKVDAAALDLLYNFDELQIGYVDKLDAALDTLDKAVTAQGDVDGAVTALDSLITEASDSFTKRADVLVSIGTSVGRDSSATGSSSVDTDTTATGTDTDSSAVADGTTSGDANSAVIDSGSSAGTDPGSSTHS